MLMMKVFQTHSLLEPHPHPPRRFYALNQLYSESDAESFIILHIRHILEHFRVVKIFGLCMCCLWVMSLGQHLFLPTALPQWKHLTPDLASELTTVCELTLQL